MELKSYQYGEVVVYLKPIAANLSLSRRERERLAEKQLLSQVIGNGVELEHTDDGKPYLKGQETYISISHSKHYLCVALCKHFEIGVDIEEPTERLQRVKSRILTADELQHIGAADTLLLALCWSAKEAVYKLAGKRAGLMGEKIVLPVEQLATERYEELIARVDDEQYKLQVLDAGEQFEIVLACRYMSR